jgi:hypothetical protein
MANASATAYARKMSFAYQKATNASQYSGIARFKSIDFYR